MTMSGPLEACGPCQSAVRRRAELEPQLSQPLSQWCEPERPAKAPTGDAGRDPAHEDCAAGVAHCDRNSRDDHAREVGAVLRRGMEVLALVGDRSAPIDVAAVDLDQVADRDVDAAEPARIGRSECTTGRTG